MATKTKKTKTPDINKILKRPEHKGYSSRGADMGRGSEVGDPCCLYVQRIRFQDGDYDTGGAYWGGGSGLYCLFSHNAGVENDTMVFVRAERHIEAIKAAKEILESHGEDGWTFHPYELPR